MDKKIKTEFEITEPSFAPHRQDWLVPRKQQDTADEILRSQISAEDKMRFIKTVDSLFEKGAAHEDLNLLRLLHAGILHTNMLSPERSEYSFGDTGHTVIVDVNGKRISVGADGNVVAEAAPVNPNIAGMPSMSCGPKLGGPG
jgi:hypothetical protein